MPLGGHFAPVFPIERGYLKPELVYLLGEAVFRRIEYCRLAVMNGRHGTSEVKGGQDISTIDIWGVK